MKWTKILQERIRNRKSGRQHASPNLSKHGSSHLWELIFQLVHFLLGRLLHLIPTVALQFGKNVGLNLMFFL